MAHTITEIDIAIRLCLAFAAGGVIGLERSSRRQVAGLRTHILITVGAACLMLLSIWLPQEFFDLKNGDPGRIAAQVVSGMGFLGAGAIIRLGNDVKGLTTAASLWLVAAIGLTIGAGMYIAALTTEALALVALIALNKAERKIFPDVRKKVLEVYYSHSGEPDMDFAAEIFKKFSIKNQSVNIYPGQDNAGKSRAFFLISILDKIDTSKLARAFEACEDVERVEIKDKV
jgi:putative Mg2+ transporter-C (MgtC) family protein